MCDSNRNKVRRKDTMNRSISLLAISLLLACLFVAVFKTESSAAATSRSTEVQDPSSLDRRISMLEQRLYFFESSMRRLEQQVSQPTTSPNNQDRTETALLRNDVENLKGQVQILTCALARIDERTL